MRSLSSLIHSALFPSTRVYHDANGNYRGSSTDVTPWLVLLGCGWGIMVLLYIILTPLLAPVYYIFANWYCRKYDAEFTKTDPKGWPKDKSQILRNHRNILLGWIIFMVWGYCVDWGQNDLPYEYTQPSTQWQESKWEPNPDGSFVEYYKSISEDNPKLIAKFVTDNQDTSDMKILHISDTHGFHHDLNHELPEADVLVHSGDFTWGGSEAEAIDFMNWLIGLPYRHKIFIAGNHDSCMYQADGIQGLPENVRFLQHSSAVIDGIKFYGVPLYMEDCMAGRYDLLLDEIPIDVDVLISHQPPLGVLDVTDYGNGPMNHGSKRLKEIITSRWPKAHLFGHEHSANGLIEENGTIFSNGSLLDDDYKQSFTPRLVEIQI